MGGGRFDIPSSPREDVLMGSITSEVGNRRGRGEMNSPALPSRPVNELAQGKAVSMMNSSKACAKMNPSEPKGLDYWCGPMSVAEWSSIWASVEH